MIKKKKKIRNNNRISGRLFWLLSPGGSVDKLENRQSNNNVLLVFERTLKLYDTDAIDVMKFLY